MFKQNKKKAFTLIETLIAITVLVTSITAPLSIAVTSVFQARYAREQVAATYLAQEAIEMIRYVRDRNMMNSLSGRTSDWLEFIPRDTWFSPDWDTAQDGDFQVCANSNDPLSCPYLRYGGAYSLNPAGDNTPFKRAVRVTVNPSMRDEITIESRVYWLSGVLGERMVSVKTHLYNWAVVENDDENP